MTDPRLQDLTELPRRLTATLDLRSLGEDLTSRAIEATGAATGAIALWDRQGDRLTTLADLEAFEIGPRMAPGETYARLEEYQAAKRVLVDRRPLTVRAEQARGRPGRAGLARPLWAERRAPAAARLARRLHRPDVPRAPRGSLQPGRPRLLAASERHRRQRDREREAVHRAPVDAHPVPLADRAAARRDLPRRPRDRRDPVREPADHRAVRHHAGRVEGEPGRLAPGRSSGRPRACRAAFEEANESARAVPRSSTASSSPDGDVRWVVDRTVVLPAGRRPADPDPGHDLRHHGPEAGRAGAHAIARITIALTGLPNRDQFRSALDEAIVRARKHGPRRRRDVRGPGRLQGRERRLRPRRG